MLTYERLIEVLHYDPETGLFTWIKCLSPNAQVGAIAGTDKDGYIRIRIDRRFYRANRLAWLYMTGEWPAHDVDHDDENKKNNTWDNLWHVTHQENCQKYTSRRKL